MTSAGVRPVAPVSADTVRLPVWPVAAAFAGYPVWWVVGAGWLAWPICAGAMVVLMVRARQWAVPRAFAIWLVFLAATVASLTQVHSATAFHSWLFNAIGYLSATVLFVYIYNQRPHERAALPSVLAVLWAATLVLGLVGMALPNLTIVTPIHAVLPDWASGNALADRFTVIHLARPTYGVARPIAPFSYANRWGAIIALTTPFAVFRAYRSPGRVRFVLTSIGVVGLLPIVYSINRTLWVCLTLSAAYLLFLAAWRRRHTVLYGGGAAVVVVLAVVLSTPLADVVRSKVAHARGTHRFESYRAVWNSFLRSPLLGHGTSGASLGEFVRGNIPVGSQGQFWTLLYAGGLLSTLPFLLWLGWVAARTWRGPNFARSVAYRIAVTVPLLLGLVYAFVPETLMVVLACQAGAWHLPRHETGDPDDIKDAAAAELGD